MSKSKTPSKPVPDPVYDSRSRIYTLLAKAAPAAITVTKLWSKGCLHVHQHVESLRYEGHRIAQVRVGDAKGWAFRLDHDAWQGQPRQYDDDTAAGHAARHADDSDLPPVLQGVT